LDYNQSVSEFGPKSLGEVLLEPTMLYTGVLNQLLESELGNSVHALSHITGGGIAANLSRVLPVGVSLEISRASWSPANVFRVLAEWGAYQLESLEGTWNLGLGFAAVVDESAATAIAAKLNQLGIRTWQLGVIEKATDTSGFITSAKGVEGGAVRLSGSFA
jgi:phosphoribosylformylglycinamidine cyclo-ligase